MRESNCIICDSRDIEFVTSKAEYELIKCINCGLTYSSPMKSQCNYSHEITHDRWDFDIMIDYIINHNRSKYLKIFELGCGDGRLLHKLTKLGYECYGVDINPDAIVSAKKKGLENVFNTPLTVDFSKKYENKFDLVVGFHVIEHIENLKEVIENVKTILKPEGILLLSVPNPLRLSARIFVESWDMPPYHLTKWTKKSLQLLLENKGFQVLNFMEEPLTLKSAYIYIVDAQIMVENILLRAKKITYSNSYSKENNIVKTKISKIGIVKKIICILKVITSYVLGYTIYISLVFFRKIKILPESLDKGLSLLVIARRKV